MLNLTLNLDDLSPATIYEIYADAMLCPSGSMEYAAMCNIANITHSYLVQKHRGWLDIHENETL